MIIKFAVYYKSCDYLIMMFNFPADNMKVVRIFIQQLHDFFFSCRIMRYYLHFDQYRIVGNFASVFTLQRR